MFRENFTFSEAAKPRVRTKVAYFLCTPFILMICTICSILQVPVYILYDGKPKQQKGRTK